MRYIWNREMRDKMVCYYENGWLCTYERDNRKLVVCPELSEYINLKTEYLNNGISFSYDGREIIKHKSELEDFLFGLPENERYGNALDEAVYIGSEMVQDKIYTLLAVITDELIIAMYRHSIDEIEYQMSEQYLIDEAESQRQWEQLRKDIASGKFKPIGGKTNN